MPQALEAFSAHSEGFKMGGGGGGGYVAPVAPAEPATPQVPTTTFEAFSPGQQGLLAEQMQAGYGGVLSDYTGQMDHYRDMKVPLLNSPGDIPNYLKNVGLEVTAGGTPANPQAFYDATQPGYQLPASGTPANAPAPSAAPLSDVPAERMVQVEYGSQGMKKYVPASQAWQYGYPAY
jgi:hypothetical protein